MARNIIVASLLAIGVAGGAQAQGAASYGVTGYLSDQVGDVVGGGSATITGGGDNLQITYGVGGAGGGGSPVQLGRFARALGGAGDGMQVEYLDEAPAGAGPGREAWMVGGGDNAEVVYASPRQRR
jgi:hypothetical protein